MTTPSPAPDERGPAAGRLVIVCGLPGSGKSTTVAAIRRDDPDVAVMSPDDWMEASGISLWDTEVRALMEAHQWELTQVLLARGRTVVIEWGTWGRSERDALIDGAHALGATVELVWLDVPLDELQRRIARREREDPPITAEQIAEYVQLFERPDDAELARYDAWSHRRD